MLFEFLLFLLELLGGIAYPLLMTIKSTVVTSEDYHDKFKSWIFYWIAFIVVQEVSSCLDFFLWSLLRTVLLIALALPQLGLSLKASNYVLGPFQSLVLEQYTKVKEQVKEKLG